MSSKIQNIIDMIFRKFIGLIIIGVILVFMIPSLVGLYSLSILSTFFLYVSLAQSWNLTGGYANQISLGHTAFLGIGAYSTFLLYMEGYPFYIGLIAGGLTAAGLSALLSKPLFRFRGAYFSIATLVLAQIFLLWFLQWEPVGAAEGLHIFPPPGWWSIKNMYLLSLFCFALTSGVVWFTINSRLGWGLKTIRDDEDAAEMIGVDTFRSKMYVLCISAFLTAIVGGIISLDILHIRPSAIFGLKWVLLMLAIPIIGGMRNFLGPIIGAGIWVGLSEALAGFPGIHMVIFGIAIIMVVLRVPEGVMGYLEGKFKPLLRLL